MSDISSFLKAYNPDRRDALLVCCVKPGNGLTVGNNYSIYVGACGIAKILDDSHREQVVRLLKEHGYVEAVAQCSDSGSLGDQLAVGDYLRLRATQNGPDATVGREYLAWRAPNGQIMFEGDDGDNVPIRDHSFESVAGNESPEPRLSSYRYVRALFDSCHGVTKCSTYEVIKANPSVLVIRGDDGLRLQFPGDTDEFEGVPDSEMTRPEPTIYNSQYVRATRDFFQVKRGRVYETHVGPNRFPYLVGDYGKDILVEAYSSALEPTAQPSDDPKDYTHVRCVRSACDVTNGELYEVRRDDYGNLCIEDDAGDSYNLASLEGRLVGEPGCYVEPTPAKTAADFPAGRRVRRVDWKSKAGVVVRTLATAHLEKGEISKSTDTVPVAWDNGDLVFRDPEELEREQ